MRSLWQAKLPGQAIALTAAAALLVGGTTAQANEWGELIEDVENTGWGELIDDPENTGWGELIDDPENTGWQEVPASPVAVVSTAPAPRAERWTGIGPRAIFQGFASTLLSIDTRHDDPWENTLESLNTLELGVRYHLSDRWRVSLSGRLTWDISRSERLTAGGAADESGVMGHVRADLGDFYLSGRAGRWIFRIGHQTLSWGSSDFLRPADPLSPLDLSRGFSMDRNANRLPQTAFAATAIWDHLEWEFVLLPFFRPHRVALYGSDISPIQPSGFVLGASPGVPGLTVLDPSLADLAQPLLLQTALPRPLPQNASLGSRLTLIRGGWDVSAGYFWGWDRTPLVTLSPAAVDLVSLVRSQGSEFWSQDLRSLPQVQALLLETMGGGSPLQATYERLHTLELDGVKYLGPVGLRFEAAFHPQKTLLLDNLESVRRPSLAATLGLSWEGRDGELISSTEVFYSHTWRELGDAPGLYGTDRVWGIATGLKLGMGAFPGIQSRLVQGLSFQLFATWLPEHRDLILAPALAWEFHPGVVARLGINLFNTWSEAPSPGDLLERNDAVWLGLEGRF